MKLQIFSVDGHSFCSANYFIGQKRCRTIFSARIPSVMANAKSNLQTAAKFLPQRETLDSLRSAAAGCTACHLHKLGTQTVFGEGSRHARVILVGEQPGDKEDLAGHPFVGPAGRVLDEALEAAGIDRKQVYVTNAVKHFKWKARGKRRIHDKPNAAELAACRPWLDGELRFVAPRILVPLGATA